jgi:hypothetical protein
MMAGLIPIGEIEAASDITTGAVIGQEGSWAQRAVDDRVEGVAAGIIASDPTVKAAAANAVANAGDTQFFRQDGARRYLGNWDFEVAPSALNAPIDGNWYNVTSVRSWETVADGPGGLPAKVVRQLSASGFTLQRIANTQTLGISGKTVTLSITARGLALNGVLFCKLRIFVTDQAGTIADITPVEHFGLEWKTLDIDIAIPATSTYVSVGLGIGGGAGNGTARGEYDSASLSLKGADIHKAIAATVAEEVDGAGLMTEATGDVRYLQKNEQRAQVMSDWLQMSKGSVGTGNAIPVSLRFDDWQDQILSLGLVDEMRNRGLFGSIVLCSRLGSNPWNQTITYDILRTWNQDYGMEIWSHGTDHNTPAPDGYAGFYREIVTSKAEIEAQNIRCMGFAQPGVAAPGYGPELDNGDWSTVPGQLLTATYPLVETDMTRTFRFLPSNLRYGLGHTTISDGATYAAILDRLEAAIIQRAGIQFMIHAGNLGVGSNMTVNQLLQFFDVLQAKVIAGEIVIVQPSTLPFCDVTHGNRRNLLGNGRFTRPVATGSIGTSNWVNINGSRSIETIADSPSGPAKVLQIAGNELASQGVTQYQGLNLIGQTVILEANVRSVGGDSTWRVGIDALEGAGTWTRSWSGPATAGWSKVRLVFTPPPTVKLGVLVILGRLASGTVQFDDVRLHVA